MVHHRDSLPPGTLVDDYRIRSTIGKGGFGLIYLAVNEESGDEVLLKEFMPKKLTRRAKSLVLVPVKAEYSERIIRSRKLFFQEAKALASLNHPNIVRVLGLFLANNTIYMVMQYERGKNLGSYVHARKGGLSTSFILQVFLPILEALSLMHSKSILHLDVKPANIHLRHGNDPILLDFGAVHLLSHERSPGSLVITAGYSPVEQYYSGGHIGPWTDVYAVGASLRTCLEGKAPLPALDRNKGEIFTPAKRQFSDRYPLFLLQAIDWAMEMDPARRPQNAGELLKALQRFEVEWPNSHTLESQPSDLALDSGHPAPDQAPGSESTRSI